MKHAKTPPKRLVTETVRIDACRKGDELDVSFTQKGHYNSVGRIVVSKIKPIPGERVQVKYVQRYSSSKKVMKTDLPADFMVERTREAVEADGPGAGKPEVRTAMHEGIPYRAIDPEDDVDELLLAAVQTGMGEGRTVTAGIELAQAIVQRMHAKAPGLTFPGSPDGVHRTLAHAQTINDDAVRAIAASGKTMMIQHATLSMLDATAHGQDKDERRDPDMERMGDWLDALDARGILQPGAKDRLMGSIWTEQEISDGRPKPGSVVIDG
jgi:hypothetical protein